MRILESHLVQLHLLCHVIMASLSSCDVLAKLQDSGSHPFDIITYVLDSFHDLRNYDLNIIVDNASDIVVR